MCLSLSLLLVSFSHFFLSFHFFILFTLARSLCPYFILLPLSLSYSMSLSLSLPLALLASLSLSPSLCLSVYLSLSLYLCLFLGFFRSLCVHFSLFPFLSLSRSGTACPSLFLFVRVSVSLFSPGGFMHVLSSSLLPVVLCVCHSVPPAALRFSPSSLGGCVFSTV